MPDRRLPRALLRLYPRAWRARYGDEFLAYVAESGLTCRGVADIVGAAAVERGRSIVDAARAQIDPSPLPMHHPPVVLRVGTLVGPAVVRGTLISLAVFVLHTAGVPYPLWTVWANLLLSGMSLPLDRTMFTTSVFDRGVASFLWFAVALGLVLVAQVIAALLRAAGVPEASEGTALSAMVAVIVGGALRGIYRGVRAGLRPADFDPIRTGEVRGWQTAAVAMAVVAGLGDLLWQALWPMTLILNLAVTLPAAMTRSGLARRRVFRDDLTRFER
jgi:hypothetical protein